MANFGPITVPFSFSNLKTLDDVSRFVSAFSQQVFTNFNALVGTRDVFGAVGSTGVISVGENFGASFVTTGTYWIEIKPSLSYPVVAVVTPLSTGIAASITGVTNSGFKILTTNFSSTATNSAFHFHAKGGR